MVSFSVFGQFTMDTHIYCGIFNDSSEEKIVFPSALVCNISSDIDFTKPVHGASRRAIDLVQLLFYNANVWINSRHFLKTSSVGTSVQFFFDFFTD